MVTLLLRPNRRSLSKKKVEAYCLMRATLASTLKSKFPAIEKIEKEALASGFLDLDEVRSVLGIDLADDSGDGSEGDSDSDASVHIDLADDEL